MRSRDSKSALEIVFEVIAVERRLELALRRHEPAPEETAQHLPLANGFGVIAPAEFRARRAAVVAENENVGQFGDDLRLSIAVRIS